MRYDRFQCIVGAAAIGLLAGCGGAMSAPQALNRPATGSHSWVSRSATGAKLLYVARYSLGNVQIYDSRTLRLVGTLAGFANPQGVAVDGQRNVYVVNQGPNVVFVFRRGSTMPFETLTDPDGIALQTAVGNDGTVYLSNEYNNHLGNGNVLEFPPGETRPTRRIDDRDFSVVEDVGLDSHNNLYVTFFDLHSVGHVNEYPPGSARGKTLPVTLNGAGGIEFDAADDLVVADTDGKAVKVFAQGSSSPKYEFAEIKPIRGTLRLRAAPRALLSPIRSQATPMNTRSRAENSATSSRILRTHPASRSSSKATP